MVSQIIKFEDENKGSNGNHKSIECRNKQTDFKIISIVLLLFVIINFGLFVFLNFKTQELQIDVHNLQLTVGNLKKIIILADNDRLEEMKIFNDEDNDSPLVYDYDLEYDDTLLNEKNEADPIIDPDAPFNIIANKPPVSLTKIGDHHRDRRATSDAASKVISKLPTDSHVKKGEIEVTKLEIVTDRRHNLRLQRRNDKTRGQLKFKQPQLKSGGTTQWESVEDRTLHPDVTIVRDTEVHHRRNRHRQRNNFETLDERPHNRNKIFPAIHLNGDTSKYVLGLHTNFNGDGHLRHPNQRYVDWDTSSWVRNLGMDQHFLVSDGFVKIKENGLYFVYAQIYYLDEHDTNGYRVYKNSETLLQCTTMTHSKDRVLKGNTCYTAGMEYLTDGDQISVQDLADGRYSLFEAGKSFFGLIKLGDVKIK